MSKLHLLPISSKCPIKGLHLYPLTELFAWPYLRWIHGVVALVVRISRTHLLAIVCGLGELQSSAAAFVREDNLAWRGVFSGDATDLSPLTCDQIPHCLPHMGSNNLSGSKLRHFFYFVIRALGLPWARLRIALGRLQHLQGFLSWCHSTRRNRAAVHCKVYKQV